jgi:hypothetical protein
MQRSTSANREVAAHQQHHAVRIRARQQPSSVAQISEEELDEGARAWGCMSDHYVWALEEVYLHGNERARRIIPLPFRPFSHVWQAAKRSSGRF